MHCDWPMVWQTRKLSIENVASQPFVKFYHLEYLHEHFFFFYKVKRLKRQIFVLQYATLMKILGFLLSGNTQDEMSPVTY